MAEEYGGTRGRGGCCRCCISFIITSGFTALFMWLSLRGSNPSCSIQDFIVPSLNVTDKNPTNKTNHTISFDLKLQNGMKDKGVHYDAINLTIYYGPNSTSPQIGNITLPGFYQGHGKTAHRTELVETHGVQWWKDAYPVVSNGSSSVVFRVDLNTRIRYKILSFYTKRHGLVIGGDVDVDGSGRKVAKKGVKLKSFAVSTGSQYCLALVVLAFAFYSLSIFLL